MSITAAVLIILSAFMHALWNFISKRRNPSLAFFFVNAVMVSIVVSPVLVFHRQTLLILPLSFWGGVLATGLAQMVYFMGLAGAYRNGDISLAYPLARSLPVLMVAGLSLMLGHRTEIGNLGLVGMLFITVGCIMLPFPRFQRMRWREYLSVVYIMAFVAAIGTTSYTLIDDYGLAQLRAWLLPQQSVQSITLLYMALQISSTTLMMGIGTLLSPSERRQLRQILKPPRQIVLGLATGLTIMATYGLVLAAMSYVNNVSYVAAFRQLSIPIGAVLGLTIQGEPRYTPKLLGIGIVSLGLILVGVG
ncbi:MAG: EamA family transporter [Chloroflexi bacterium]|jgi:uncharacterized membrane protein|nr:EamA family transporter [Chloroflexota bacterium]